MEIMETSIHDLNDDCLLEIFDHLDPLTWTTLAQVCSKWDRLLQNRWKQFTMVNLNDPMFCYSHPATRQKIGLINTDEVKTIMHKIGSNLKSVVVGLCQERSVICVRNPRRKFIYRIWGKFDAQDFIGTLPQTCSNLSVLKIEKPDVEFTAHWVQQLVNNCRDLKVVVLRAPLGAVNVAFFLTLPRLEYLSVTGATFFSSVSFNVNIASTEFKHLNVLEVKFASGKLLDCSGLFDVIERMPVLDYFHVQGLPEHEATELSCKAIESRVNDRKIIVLPSSQEAYEATIDRKDVNPDVDPEPFRLIIKSRGSNYDHIIRKFVGAIKECSVRKHKNFVVVPEWRDEFSPLSWCKCLHSKTNYPRIFSFLQGRL